MSRNDYVRPAKLICSIDDKGRITFWKECRNVFKKNPRRKTSHVEILIDPKKQRIAFLFVEESSKDTCVVKWSNSGRHLSVPTHFYTQAKVNFTQIKQRRYELKLDDPNEKEPVWYIELNKPLE